MFIDGKLVADELKSIRTRKGLSIKQVSEDIGIHFNSLSKYEKNADDMQLNILEKLLAYYNIDELIFFKVIREYNH